MFKNKNKKKNMESPGAKWANLWVWVNMRAPP